MPLGTEILQLIFDDGSGDASHRRQPPPGNGVGERPGSRSALPVAGVIGVAGCGGRAASVQGQGADALAKLPTSAELCRNQPMGGRVTRKLRRFLHLLGPVVGLALVVGAIVFGEALVVQLFLVMAGLLLMEAGIWRLAEPILPDERKYVALRAETDHFMTLVRQLNTAAVALDEGETRGARFAMDELQTEMHRSIDRMVSFAGKTEHDAAPDAAGPGGTAAAGPGADPDATRTGA